MQRERAEVVTAVRFLAYEAVGVENPAPEPWDTLIAKLVASLTPSPAADGTPPPTVGDPILTGATHGQ